MFAITADGFRAIANAAQLLPGETLSNTVPKQLLDTLPGATSQPTLAELQEQLTAIQEQIDKLS